MSLQCIRRARWGVLATFMVAAVAGALAGCGRQGEAGGKGGGSGGGKVRAVCTTGMVSDIVRNLGGAHVATEALMGEGVDPHLYKPSPQDVRKLSQASIIFYSGLHLEGQMGEILERVGKTRPAVAVAEAVDPSKLMYPEPGQPDPHLWFDVALWSETIQPVQEALSRLAPAQAAEFEANAAAYRTRLQALHTQVQSDLAKIPEGARVLVTAHDAFGYFARAYAMEVHAIQGISTDSEAALKDINALVDLLVARRIPAVFVESSVPPKNIQALVEGCAARGHAVVIGGSLFSDAMGAPGTPEGTYEGMVRHNVKTIVDALSRTSSQPK